MIPYLTKLIIKLAPKVGASVVLEPQWKVVAQIIYKNGVVRSLRSYSLDLNPIASSDIAGDKGYAKFFLKKRGYQVADGITVLKDSWAKAIKGGDTASRAFQYAKKTGYPVIVKPNSKSQGVGVSLASNQQELSLALKNVFKQDRIALVEKYMPGHDYRVVVLDGKIISAYERIALSVTGDGENSILNLLVAKQKSFIKSGRDTRINFNDPRIKLKLKRQGLNFKSVLSKGKRVYLLDNANLSTGGDASDMTKSVHPGFKKISAAVARDMGLRLCGVDIMVTSGDITLDPNKCEYYIIEINSAPGLDHYVTTGAAQKKIVEDMYLEILKALGKKD